MSVDKGQASLDELAEQYAAADEGHGTTGALDLSAARVDWMLETTPPKREWLVQDRLPHGVVGILGAAGGTGKGFATLQLAVSLATGQNWLGMPMGKRGSTLIFSAEDDRDEMHRRLLRVVQEYQGGIPFEDEPSPDEIKADVSRNVYILDRVGADNRLTDQMDRRSIRTAFASQIIETVQGMDEPPALIVLDPLSRFDGGDPNDNADGTRLIETAEHIRKETGSTVIIPHHVNKASSKDNDAGAEAIRGASGLVDGARWVGHMATLRRDEAKTYGISEDDARWYTRFKIVKGNYGPPWEGCWLIKGEGGVLHPTELTPVKQAKQDKQEQKADEQYQNVLSRTRELIRKHGPMTRRHIKMHYAGTTGVLQVGRDNAMAAIERAVEEGKLFLIPDSAGPYMLLSLEPAEDDELAEDDEPN